MSSISVITICFNDRLGLERTFTSVFAQTAKDIEYIVVDGGSTDGSAELVRTNATHLARWVSEKDAGIYDAQNKGWRMATAPWVLFLNAGDTFTENNVLERALAAVDQQTDIVFGDLQLRDEHGPLRYKAYPDRITSAWLMKESPPHPSQLVRRALLERLGGFDTDFRIAADYAFFARAFWKIGIRVQKLPFPVAVFDTQGFSSDPAQQANLWRERKEVHRRYAPSFWFMVYHAYAALNRFIGR